MNIYKDISLLTTTYNRHEFTYNMVVSFLENSNIVCPIFILDNSDKIPFETPISSFISVIDNTNYKNTPNFFQASKNHCASIDYAFYSVIQTKYVLLVDNDVVFHPSIITIINNRNKYNLIGEIGHDIVPGDRLFPYMCIIDLEWVKSRHIHYFDEPRCITPQKTMDTGASFLEDCLYYNPSIMKIHLSDYIIHLKGGTLHNKKFPFN